MQNLTMTSIGTVKSPYREKFGVPRQPNLVPQVAGKIEIHLPDYREYLDGLTRHTHLWIIFGFSLNSNKTEKRKVHPPRFGGEKMGVLSTRSPHRPNPIGLSVVKLLKVEDNIIFVEGLDL